MNAQNPLVPKSSFLEQKNKGRARVKIAVFVVLAIHGIGLMALLMQGCQKPPEPPPEPLEPTNVTPAFAEPTNVPVAPTGQEVAPVTPTAPAVSPTPEGTTMPATPLVGATEHVVAKGESFSSLAKKYNVSVKAIADANPGVDSTKLKIGQTLHIPAALTPAVPAATAASAEPSSTGGEQIYTVKSGDNLSTIAKTKGTTVKALRAANNLRTDRITVGQRLKIPLKASAPAKSSVTPADPALTVSPAVPATPSGP